MSLGVAHGGTVGASAKYKGSQQPERSKSGTRNTKRESSVVDMMNRVRQTEQASLSADQTIRLRDIWTSKEAAQNVLWRMEEIIEAHELGFLAPDHPLIVALAITLRNPALPTFEQLELKDPHHAVVSDFIQLTAKDWDVAELEWRLAQFLKIRYEEIDVDPHADLLEFRSYSVAVERSWDLLMDLASYRSRGLL